MLPNHLRRLGFALLDEGEHGALESGDEKRFGVGLGQKHGFVNFKYPANIGAVHPMRRNIIRVGLQVFLDDFFKGRRFFQ